jgi:RNA polymerase sigma-70 factor (ECF subfamily)
LELFGVIPAIRYEDSRMKTLPEQLSDEELTRLIQNGHDMAFTALYRRHQGSVFRFALHMSGQVETAEEVTQDVFFALARDPHVYQPDRGSIQSFLIGVARNKVRHRLNDSPVSASLEALVAPGDPFHEYARSTELHALHRAILGLPVRYREVVILCDLEELDYQTAARLLDCPIGTVRSRLSRAREFLAAKLVRRERCTV